MKQKMLQISLMLCVFGAGVSTMYGAECDSPCRRERICALEPLYYDGFNIQFHAGVSPIIWKNRGCMDFVTTSTCVSCISTSCSSSIASDLCPSTVCTGCVMPVTMSPVNCSDVCDSTVVTRIAIPKFSKLFDTPWTIGATLGYGISAHNEIFFEFNYTQASDKRGYFLTPVTNLSGTPVLLQTNLAARYKNASLYFGYRYNFNRRSCFPVCFLGDMSWFLALKAGMLHHFGIRGFMRSSLSSDIAEGIATPTFDVFKSNTTFSGAGEVGVDICLNCDWSLMVAAEISGSWGPTCGADAITVSNLGSNTIKTAKVGAEIIFPVTFGLRYKF